MNASTYARLIKPAQFKPDEDVIFRMEFSQDLICCWATLKIYGYKLSIDGTDYTGTTVTEYINVSWLGTGWVEFTVPANTLAVNPTDDSYGFSGRMKAVVEIGVQTDGNGEAIPQFTSNEILVDMLVQLPNDFEIVDTPLSATGSRKKITVHYIPRVTLGTYGVNDINSYQVLLYDDSYNLVSDSGTLYDWENSSVSYKDYVLKGLADDRNYYVKVKATLVGGYTLSTDYTPLLVNYTDTPTLSSNLSLSNDMMNGCVVINIKSGKSFDRVVISRTVTEEDNYLELKTVHTPNNETTYRDFYALPNTSYLYKAVLFSGETIVDTYYNTITHKLSGMAIADAYGGYGAIAYENLYPINRNNRGAILETMDSRYPYYIVNGTLDYDNGTVTNVYITHMEDCEFKQEDNDIYSKLVREWLNNGRAKLLKYYNGECWLVATHDISNDKPNMVTTSFSWTQIGDVNNNEDYVKLGLILNE